MISATKLTLKWYLPCYPSNDFYFFQWTVMLKFHTSNPKLCSSCPLGFLWNQEERERKPVQMSKGLSFWRLTSSNLPWNQYEDSTSMTMTKNDQADILPLEFWFQSHKGEVIPGFHCKWFMLHFFLQMWSYALENCKLETCQRNDSGKRTPQVQFHFLYHSSQFGKVKQQFQFVRPSAQLARHPWMVTWLVVIHPPKPVVGWRVVSSTKSVALHPLLQSALPLQSAGAM